MAHVIQNGYMTNTTTKQPPLPVWTTGDRMAKAREFADLTQQQMADRLRIGRRSITRYEQSNHPPRPIVVSYSAITGVPLWWFDGPESPDWDGDAATTWYTRVPQLLAA